MNNFQRQLAVDQRPRHLPAAARGWEAAGGTAAGGVYTPASKLRIGINDLEQLAVKRVNNIQRQLAVINDPDSQ